MIQVTMQDDIFFSIMNSFPLSLGAVLPADLLLTYKLDKYIPLTSRNIFFMYASLRYLFLSTNQPFLLSPFFNFFVSHRKIQLETNL